jgi:DNA polymerase elongation subunit (family B)
MFSRYQLEQILFLDIETASMSSHFDGLPEPLRAMWERKCELLKSKLGEPCTAAELYQDRAAIFAEFGKVVCISCGFIRFIGDKPTFRLKSFYGEQEHDILKAFSTMVNGFMALKPDRNLCAHNGKEFDFPYLGRRYLINGLPLPVVFADIQNKKPWEVKLIDTMQLWKFGDFKSFTSLELLCAVFGIESPKGDIDGSQVGRVYWEEKDYARIARYCERDVVATAQVLLRMSGEPQVAVADIGHAG